MRSTIMPHYSIRNTKTPLTLDQIRAAAPSAFAAEPYHKTSSRYAYIPTVNVIEGMMKAGFQPFAASQSRTSIEDKRAHTKHMIRFRSPDVAVAKVGDVFPELVLINSHDGTSAYKLMAGLFRLACTNGLIVSDSMIGTVNIKHTGKVIEEVASGSVELVEHMPEAVDAVARWQQIQLSQAEQQIFAEAAHVVRFADSEGKIETPIQPKQLLRVRRSDDSRADLWSVFNRVQENVVKGGVSAYDSTTHRRVSTREIKGIDQDVKLNRALWTLGQKMAELHN